MITLGKNRHMDEFTYSNFCMILGKLDGFVYGIVDEKQRAYLEEICKQLTGLLSEDEK